MVALLTFGARSFPVVGAVWCMVGCLTASLACDHQQHAPHPRCDNQKCLQISLNATLGGKITPGALVRIGDPSYPAAPGVGVKASLVNAFGVNGKILP